MFGRDNNLLLKERHGNLLLQAHLCIRDPCQNSKSDLIFYNYGVFINNISGFRYSTESYNVAKQKENMPCVHPRG